MVFTCCGGKLREARETDATARPRVGFVEPEMAKAHSQVAVHCEPEPQAAEQSAQPAVQLVDEVCEANPENRMDHTHLLVLESEPEVQTELHRAALQLGKSSPARRSRLDSLRHTSAVEHASAAEDEFLSPTTRRKRVVLVAGPPCSGKGTQCDYMVGRYGLVHINPGDMLREHVRRNTQLGRQAAPFMERGELVPTDVVVATVVERLSRPDVTNRGCVLNNFPLTAEQAKAMQGRVHVDLFIQLEVPQEKLTKRARGRRIDPHTGSIYNIHSHPPPAEAMERLEQRSDDAESLINLRLQTFDTHLAEITAWFEGVRHCINADRLPSDVFSSIAGLLDDHGWGATEATPYIGSKAFGGAFSSTDARRGGFFSLDEPPDEGDQVSCFQRGENFRKQGLVAAIEMLESDGTSGLLCGMVGAWVTVRYEVGGTHAPSTVEFQTWAEYLAPVNDMEYSSICSTRKYLASNYRRLSHTSTTELRQLPSAVSAVEAQTALTRWLENLVDSDGEPVAVKPGTCDELVQAFTTKTAEQSPSLYLYSTDTTIAPRISLTLGLDYSKYYRALNNTLNHDIDGPALRCVIPLVGAMVYDLCCFVDGTPRQFEQDTRVWKGDAQRPVPLNRQKLREAYEMRTVVRFRQFQSATTDEKIACKYRRREESRGFLWTIDIPAGFVGARDISDIAWRAKESETLFPPYSAFLVVSVSKDGCHLLAVDKATEVEQNMSRHGLRGTRRHQAREM